MALRLLLKATKRCTEAGLSLLEYRAARADYSQMTVSFIACSFAAICVLFDAALFREADEDNAVWLAHTEWMRNSIFS